MLIFIYIYKTIFWTTTLSGHCLHLLPPCQDTVFTSAGHPTFPPIPTDGEVLYSTTNVISITAGLQTRLQALRHPSNYFLFLTRPDLHSALMPLRDLDLPLDLLLLFSSNATGWSLLFLCPRATPKAPLIPTHLLALSSITFYPGSEILQIPHSPFFKFKNKTHANDFAVKTPLSTCNQRKDLFNLPSSKFLLSQPLSFQPQPMQRRIVTFSSPTKVADTQP
jgi:hypothetical protein